MCCPSYEGAHRRLHQNSLRELIGVIIFMSNPNGPNGITPKNQDAFEHNKGQKSAISGRRLHRIFQNFLQWSFFPFSPGLLCNLVRSKEITPKCGEKLPDFRPEKKRRIVSRLWLSCFFFSVPNEHFTKELFWHSQFCKQIQIQNNHLQCELLRMLSCKHGEISGSNIAKTMFWWNHFVVVAKIITK